MTGGTEEMPASYIHNGGAEKWHINWRDFNGIIVDMVHLQH